MKVKEILTDHGYLLLAILIASIMGFYQLGTIPLYDWDESRNGVNAIEMLETGDFINLHYMGKVDHWNSKPPLMIWSMAASYKIWGCSIFAMRFPVALASVGCIFFLFLLVSMYKSRQYAFFVCMITLSVAGFSGYHVSRTGDFDIPLLFFLLGGTYYLMSYVDFGKSRALAFAVLMFGLAFLVKGFASWILFPALGLYLLLTQGAQLFKKYWLWAAGLGILSFPIMWHLILNYYASDFDNTTFGQNSSEMIFKKDVWDRLFHPEQAEPRTAENYFYFFIYLDSRFNYWYAAFYLSLVFILKKLYSKCIKGDSKLQILLKKDKILLLSCCVIITFAVFFTFARNINFWYLAPMVSFLAVFSYYGINDLIKTRKWLLILVIVLTTAGLLNRFSIINNDNGKSAFFKENFTLLKEARKIKLGGKFPDQSIYLYLKLANQNLEYTGKELVLEKEEIGVIDQQTYSASKNKFESISNNNNYVIVKRK